MKKYKLKHGGRVITNANVVRDVETLKIQYIDWSSAYEIDLEFGVEFTEDEKDFMINRYENIEVFEVEQDG